MRVHPAGETAKRKGYVILENLMEKGKRCGRFAEPILERFVRGEEETPHRAC